MTTQPLLFSLPLLALVWTAAIWDVRTRRVPNWLTGGGAVAAISLYLFTDPGGVLSTALTGVAVGGAVLLPGFFLRSTGAADVKLMAAAGGFLGPAGAFTAALTAIVAGALTALILVAVRQLAGGGGSPWGRYGLMLKTLLVTGRAAYVRPAAGEVMGAKFPFAVAIAVGVTLVTAGASPGFFAG